MVIDCVICMEPLFEDVVATPCGHVFHDRCLSTAFSDKRLWERTCPICNGQIKANTMRALYVSVSSDNVQAHMFLNMSEKIETLESKVKKGEQRESQLMGIVQTSGHQIVELQSGIEKLEKSNATKQTTIDKFKEKMSMMEDKLEKAKQKEKEWMKRVMRETSARLVTERNAEVLTTRNASLNEENEQLRIELEKARQSSKESRKRSNERDDEENGDTQKRVRDE